MKLVLITLELISLLELCLWLPVLKVFRRLLAAIILIALITISFVLLGHYPSLWMALFLWLTAYRSFNLLRIIKNRLQISYLSRVALQTSAVLIAAQFLVLAIMAGSPRFDLPTPVTWTILIGGQLMIALVLLASTVRHLRTTRPMRNLVSYADKDLPTLTVAIPARNETADLEACLQSLVASNYPKLEILVLDDCSASKRTPEIIRAFAHDGVRFIDGNEPPETWLAKNWGYEQLRHEANGDLLLFCGVDLRFGPDSLRQIVSLLLTKEKTMLSLMPINKLPRGLASLMIQPVRYAWEMSLPRRLFKRPPVLSTCWLIKSEALDKYGGFKSVSRSISPESSLARQAAREDGYSFMQGSPEMAIISAKSLPEQRETAIRLRYPQLRRRPEQVGILGLIEVIGLLLPFIMLFIFIVRGAWMLAILNALVCIILTWFYALIVKLTYRRFTFRSLWILPLAILYDIAVINYSMWQYELGEVIWKGRNICLPLVRAIPSLPKS